MSRDQKLSSLTRTLLVGASLGTVALTQIGCAPAPQAGAYTPGATPGTIRVLSQHERELCLRALQSRNAASVNALLERYPNSQCIPPLLGAMPAPVLAALSPAAIAGLSPEMIRSLPPRVQASLPTRPAGVVRVRTPGRY